MDGLRCVLGILILVTLLLPITGEECPACTGGVRQGCCQWECFGNHLSFDIFCEDGAVINVTGAEFGISKCPTQSPCCPVKGDCRVPVVAYKKDEMDRIYGQCNEKSRCDYLKADHAGPIKECNNIVSNYEIIFFDCVSEYPTTTITPSSTITSITSTSGTGTTGTTSQSVTSSFSTDFTSGGTHQSTLDATTEETTTPSTSFGNISTTDMITEPPTEEGLSAGAIAGIVIGVILLILIILIVVFCCMVRRKNPNWPQLHNWKEPFHNFKDYIPDVDVPAIRKISTAAIGLQNGTAVRESNVTVVRTPHDATMGNTRDGKMPDENFYHTINERDFSMRRPRQDSFNSVAEDFDGDGDRGSEEPASSKMAVRSLGASLTKSHVKNDDFPALSRDVSLKSENQYDVIKDEDLISDRGRAPVVKNPGYVRDKPTKPHKPVNIDTPKIMVNNMDYDSLSTSEPIGKEPLKSKPTIMIANAEYDTFPDIDPAKVEEQGSPVTMFPNSAYDSLGDDINKARSTQSEEGNALYTKVLIQNQKGSVPNETLERYTKDELHKDSPKVGEQGLLRNSGMKENRGYESDSSSTSRPNVSSNYYNCEPTILN